MPPVSSGWSGADETPPRQLFTARSGAVNRAFVAYGRSPAAVAGCLMAWHPGSEHHYVLMQYRLPRVVLALIIGMRAGGFARADSGRYA